MPLITSSYHEIRPRMLPGDVVAFSGKNNFSDVIKWATGATVSHVGIVYSIAPDEEGADGAVAVHIMESTFLHRDVKTGQSSGGVLRNRLCHHVEHYEGHIWWLPLSAAARARLDAGRLTQFLLDQQGKEYDVAQAVGSALDVLDGVPLVGAATYNEENFTRFFCSELATAALEAGGVIGRINASEVTPIDLCTFSLFAEEYHLLKGGAGSIEIEGYNSRSPERFGEAG
ncbi:hypothetical protein [Verrucomicrobium sp. BvORR106]|uniref:hypothetical protein n=1 Tax=Verrucomicrobium sp. BvORR106 TaxID=1403819 RepID=UPI0005700BA1|nr:hypothetical protein [Verrucomicrobium sp. BvORR106]